MQLLRDWKFWTRKYQAHRNVIQNARKAAWCLNKAHEVQSMSQCSVPRCVPGMDLQGRNMENRIQNPKVLPLCSVELLEEGEFLVSQFDLSISKEGKSKISQGSLFPEFFPTRVGGFFMFKLNSLYFRLRPLPLVLSLGTTEKY